MPENDDSSTFLPSDNQTTQFQDLVAQRGDVSMKGASFLAMKQGAFTHFVNDARTIAEGGPLTGWKIHASTGNPQALVQLVELAAEYKLNEFKVTVDPDRMQSQSVAKGQAGKSVVFYHSEADIDGKPINWAEFLSKASNIIEANGGPGVAVADQPEIAGSKGLFYRNDTPPQGQGGTYMSAGDAKTYAEADRAANPGSKLNAWNVSGSADPFVDIDVSKVQVEAVLRVPPSPLRAPDAEMKQATIPATNEEVRPASKIDDGFILPPGEESPSRPSSMADETGPIRTRTQMDAIDARNPANIAAERDAVRQAEELRQPEAIDPLKPKAASADTDGIIKYAEPSPPPKVGTAAGDREYARNVQERPSQPIVYEEYSAVQLREAFRAMPNPTVVTDAGPNRGGLAFDLTAISTDTAGFVEFLASDAGKSALGNGSLRVILDGDRLIVPPGEVGNLEALAKEDYHLQQRIKPLPPVDMDGFVSDIENRISAAQSRTVAGYELEQSAKSFGRVEPGQPQAGALVVEFDNPVKAESFRQSLQILDVQASQVEGSRVFMDALNAEKLAAALPDNHPGKVRLGNAMQSLVISSSEPVDIASVKAATARPVTVSDADTPVKQPSSIGTVGESSTLTGPSAKTTAKLGASNGAVGLGMGIYQFATAQDNETRTLAAANIGVGALDVASNAAKAVGVSSPGLEVAGKIASKAVVPLVAASAAVEAYREEGTGADDKLAFKSARVAGAGATFTVGMAAGSLAAGTTLAEAGILGFSAAVAAPVAAAVGAAYDINGAIDIVKTQVEIGKIYAEQDRMFYEKQDFSNMKSAAQRVFSGTEEQNEAKRARLEQLGAKFASSEGPGRFELDLTDKKTRAVFEVEIASMGVAAAQRMQEAAAQVPSTTIGLWLSSNGQKAQDDYSNAKSDVAIFEAAQKEMETIQKNEGKYFVDRKQQEVEVKQRLDALEVFAKLDRNNDKKVSIEDYVDPKSPGGKEITQASFEQMQADAQMLRKAAESNPTLQKLASDVDNLANKTAALLQEAGAAKEAAQQITREVKELMEKQGAPDLVNSIAKISPEQLALVSEDVRKDLVERFRSAKANPNLDVDDPGDAARVKQYSQQIQRLENVDSPPAVDQRKPAPSQLGDDMQKAIRAAGSALRQSGMTYQPSEDGGVSAPTGGGKALTAGKEASR